MILLVCSLVEEGGEEEESSSLVEAGGDEDCSNHEVKSCRMEDDVVREE
jgi:hypothetical protein